MNFTCCFSSLSVHGGGAAGKTDPTELTDTSLVGGGAAGLAVPLMSGDQEADLGQMAADTRDYQSKSTRDKKVGDVS